MVHAHEPGDILRHNQYKMHWVGASVRVINFDSLLDKINNAREKPCQKLQEGKNLVCFGGRA